MGSSLLSSQLSKVWLGFHKRSGSGGISSNASLKSSCRRQTQPTIWSQSCWGVALKASVLVLPNHSAPYAEMLMPVSPSSLLTHWKSRPKLNLSAYLDSLHPGKGTCLVETGTNWFPIAKSYSLISRLEKQGTVWLTSYEWENLPGSC